MTNNTEELLENMVQKMVLSSITLSKASLSASKKALIKKFYNAKTVKELEQVKRVAQSNIAGTIRYHKRNTKSITKGREQAKSEMYAKFVDDMKFLIKKIDEQIKTMDK